MPVSIDLEGAEHIVRDDGLDAAGSTLKKRGHIILVPQVGYVSSSLVLTFFLTILLPFFFFLFLALILMNSVILLSRAIVSCIFIFIA
jgi:hypothetical protein